ncbi:MAG: DUF3089 domain-containing protein [Prevotella sp.]|nr:DUF3089 domain-containing protein [Prevotella sp.]
MNKKTAIFWGIIAIMMVGCTTTKVEEASKWADESKWFDSGKTVNEDLVDVFYIVSTEILEEKNDKGKDMYIGALTDKEKEAIDAELGYIQGMFGDSLNFFAPYYNQYTMSSLALPEKEFTEYRKKALDDAADAFHYYLKNLNNGRPFIIAGFSQGGMHLVDMLKDIDEEDYKRMVAGYSLGYRLSEEDLKYPCVKAAQSADDLGTIVSFNSVATKDAIWPIISADAATCMNPINWRTDATPATFTFEDDTLSVQIDTTVNVLIVNSKKIDSYRFPILEKFCKPGNLHHWDLLFYKDAIKENAMRRVRNYKK